LAGDSTITSDLLIAILDYLDHSTLFGLIWPV
jgi:hypothetical protein